MDPLLAVSEVPILWLTFWQLVIISSLAWYAGLMFYVAWKGAGEIARLTRHQGMPSEEGPQSRHHGEPSVAKTGEDAPVNP